jgi:hypothetical protein
MIFTYISAFLNLNKEGMTEEEMEKVRLKYNRFVYDIKYKKFYF